MIQYKEWIEDGLSIRKREDSYDVFTIPTQHFTIDSLEELTPERFALEVERQKELHRTQTEMFNIAFGDYFTKDIID